MPWPKRCVYLSNLAKLAKNIQVSFIRGISTLEGDVDRYNGITVDVQNEIPANTSVADFHTILKGKIPCYLFLVNNNHNLKGKTRLGVLVLV